MHLKRRKIGQMLAEHKLDAILHQDSDSHIDRSIEGPAICIETTSFAHAACWKAHAYTGTLCPSVSYSASKATPEHLVRAWHRTYGIHVMVTNCANNHGSYHFPKKNIPHLTLNTLHGRSLLIYGVGAQVRECFYLAAQTRTPYSVGEPSVIYNVGGHEIGETICDISDELKPFVTTSREAPNPITPSSTTANLTPAKSASDAAILAYSKLIYVTDRLGQDRRYAVDSRKKQSEVGGMLERTFESALRKIDHQLVRLGRRVLTLRKCSGSMLR